MLLISSSVVPSCSARAFISSSRSDSSSSLSFFHLFYIVLSSAVNMTRYSFKINLHMLEEQHN